VPHITEAEWHRLQPVRIYSGPCNDFAIVDTANIPGITWTHLNLSAQPTDKTTSTASPVRYRIVALLAVFSLVAYILRMNTSVAAKFMMPDLGLTEIQMGQVFSAFMLGYAIFQIPWGLLGDRSGPSRMLTIAALIWVITTTLTGLAPGHLIPAFAALLILRFLLGVGQAALYPLAARAVGNWMPGSERAFAYSIIIAAAAAGSAFTGPLIAWSMVALGWRMAFYLCAALALIIAGLWFWYATDRPAAHVTIAISRSSWARLLRDRNILLICASYFLSSYVLFMFIFWFYLYLVDERKFSILSGGMFTSMPYILALIVVPVGGRLSDRLGRRVVAMAGFGVAAAALFVGTRAANPYAAIAALSVSVAFLMATEGPFWSSTIHIAGEHAGAAGGIMNMAGNLGGVVSTALVPVLVKNFGWAIALGSGSGLAIVGGLLWLLIRPGRPNVDGSNVVQSDEGVPSP
jgi:MFS transporter, ACS family, glucarate transporter